jgi:hypothetical protein
LKPNWSVPRLWPGETVALLGTGPSLSQREVDYLRGKCRVIAINSAWVMAPWADVLYACDFRWWEQYWQSVRDSFNPQGLCIRLGRNERHPEEEVPEIIGGVNLKALKHCGTEGIETDPSGLRTGRNSGYQALNLAIHFGAVRILLLAYDLKQIAGKTHFFGDYPKLSNNPALYPILIGHFEDAAPEIAALGVEVINCTEGSALKAFPVKQLRDVI